jgi:tetraacyldisaccharide 4'-kinase
MNFLRKILFPFAVLYGWIMQFRNFLFDKGFLKSYRFDVPIIAVGNLSVGGTGKTPQIEYLIRLLSDTYKIATLSRGYKRESEGFVLADPSSNASILGDEPFQFYSKFPNIQVAVDANRKNGIENLLAQKEPPEVILLDDAFQHRRVKAGFYILLTSYDDLFYNDYILPTGHLREGRCGAKRANMIIVTKCPKDLSELAQAKIAEKIAPYFKGKMKSNDAIFFSYIDYDDRIYSINETKSVNELKLVPKVLVAGIAKPKPFFDFLQTKNDVILTFQDHHHFSEKDILAIKKQAKEKSIVTTEKDYMRLKNSLLGDQLYYLPIKTSFLNKGDFFDKTILNYVGKSTRNS